MGKDKRERQEEPAEEQDFDFEELDEEELEEAQKFVDEPIALLVDTARIAKEAANLIDPGDVAAAMNAAFLVQEAGFKLQEASRALLRQAFEGGFEDPYELAPDISALAAVHFPQPIFFAAGFPAGKIRALATIIADILGIPVDLFYEFFLDDLKDLYRALWRGESKNKWDKASKILERMLKKLKSRGFRKFLEKRLGKAGAAKLLAKFAFKKIPIILVIVIVATIIANLGAVLDP